MSKPISIGIEKTDDGFWSYIQRSPGVMPHAPLFEVLKWILQQLTFGHFACGLDHDGAVVSLTIGKHIRDHETSIEEASELVKKRLLSVNLAGVMAIAREKGIAPEHDALSKSVSLTITDGGRRNTEFYYAFELINVLARLNKKTFKLDAPPISGIAPNSVVAYLQEGTRCWLYGFYGASVAMSRACLEESLKVTVRLPSSSDLSGLIFATEQIGRLDSCMAEVAHSIRRTGNKFLHGEQINELDSRNTLDGIRSVVTHLFST